MYVHGMVAGLADEGVELDNGIIYETPGTVQTEPDGLRCAVAAEGRKVIPAFFRIRCN